MSHDTPGFHTAPLRKLTESSQNITPPMAKGLGLPIEHGVVIADVQPDGPADQVGIKRRTSF